MDEGEELQEGGLLLEEPPDIDALERFLDSAFDMRLRVFPDALILLAYAKLCTYSGVPWSVTLGSVYFVSWLVLEVVLVVQHLRRRGAGEQEQQERLKEALTRVRDESKWRRNASIALFAQLVVAGRLLAFLTLAIVAIVARQSQTPPSPSPHPSSTRRIFTFLGDLWTWALTPTYSAFKWFGGLISTVSKPLGTKESPLAAPLAFLYFIFVLYPVFFVLGCIVCVVTILNALTFAGVVILVSAGTVTVVFLSVEALLRRLLHPRSFTFIGFVLLAGSLFYYIKLFDPTGTSKRAWSEALG